MRAVAYVHLADETVTRADALGALNVAAARREWEVVALVEDDDGTRLEEAYRRMDGGAAEVLVVLPRLPANGELPACFARARAGGWRVALPAVGVEQGRPSGDRMEARIAQRIDLASLAHVPMPPAELRRRVTGSSDEAGFDRSGREYAAALAAVAERHGHPWRALRTVLDFGCGPGRILRAMHDELPTARLTGADTDAESIAWVRSALPTVEAVVVPELPPTTLAAEAHELVLAISVLTHLDERRQDAWLPELARVTAPGGLVLATYHGELATAWHRDHPLVDLGSTLEDVERDGIAFWRDDGWDAIYPDWYHTTFHTDAYVRERWGRWFEVLELVPAFGGSMQDLAVLTPLSPRGPVD